MWPPSSGQPVPCLAVEPWVRTFLLGLSELRVGRRPQADRRLGSRPDSARQSNLAAVRGCVRGSRDELHPEQNTRSRHGRGAALYLWPVRGPGSSQVGPIFRHRGAGSHARRRGQVDAHGRLVGTHGRTPGPLGGLLPPARHRRHSKHPRACLGKTAPEEWASSKRAGRRSPGLWQTLLATGK